MGDLVVVGVLCKCVGGLVVVVVVVCAHACSYISCTHLCMCMHLTVYVCVGVGWGGG